MAGQTPSSLIIEDVLFDPTTSLGDVERQFAGAEGYIGAKISHTRLNRTARIVQNFVFEFSTAADAARALRSRITITVGDRAYTVQPHGGFTCSICMAPFEDHARAVPCRRCKLLRCHDCVRRDFKAAMEDMERMPLRCCNTVIHHETAREILPTVELEAYKSRFDELSTINPLYCPVPTCSTFLPPRIFDEKGSKATCPTCDARVCTNCKQLANDGHACYGDEKRNFILDTFSYKTCPKCGMGVARMFGCSHIRCRCGAHWCWDCQRPILACYQRPCQAAREDGNTPQEDAEDEEVEADADDDELETQGHNVSPERGSNDTAIRPTGSDSLVVVSDQQHPQHHPQIVQESRAHANSDSETVKDGQERSSEPPNLGFAALLAAIDMRGSREGAGGERAEENIRVLQEEAPNMAEANTIPASGTNNAVVAVDPRNGRGNNTIMDNQTEMQTQAAAESTIAGVLADTAAPSEDNGAPDLDEPDLDEWEGAFDFGSEPNDEAWDVWGCRHRFRKFNTAAIPDFWMVGLDPRHAKLVEIECMACFRKVAVYTDEDASKKEKKLPEAQGQDQPNNAVKPGTWECKSCGVIYCKPCVKFAKKRMVRERRSGDSDGE
ncbi:hypothetical protein PV08_05243 [Exophiala spinifera]|uniref:RBR-type E3 ubiquitin transferase n=1 Tax=Exophiala spinifera TaxID=91928 RepID=A0A0D2B8E2_9EURO|nr:uncharacterized protein PV08_05243 [Exophiala spinifera]KIW15198.1 hypothetical protein PV08_05243 [Exophiala spinifera]